MPDDAKDETLEEREQACIEQTWHVVYGLVDPDNMRLFYVGVSSQVRRRQREHETVKTSAAWARAAHGKRKSICIVFDECENRNDALTLESRLIRLLPHLENKSGNPDYAPWRDEGVSRATWYRRQAAGLNRGSIFDDD